MLVVLDPANERIKVVSHRGGPYYKLVRVFIVLFKILFNRLKALILYYARCLRELSILF